MILSAPSARRAIRKGASVFLVDIRRGIPAGLDTDATKHHTPIVGSVDASATSTPCADDLVPHGVLDAVLQKYKDSFAELPKGLPPDRGARHSIQLVPRAKPPCRPMYRLSPGELSEVKAQIEHLLSMGFIEPTDSPYGSPILFVMKKDGTLRMVIDYRAINALTVRNNGPLPLISDLYDKLGGAKVFSTFDLASGYHQILLHESDVDKTAFRTPLGSFAFRVLPFGLTNAGAVFQAQMNRIFREHLGKFVLVYLDDIYVYSRTAEDHIVHLEKVMEILRENKFYAKLSKCEFNKPELPFLGHIVGRNGLKVDPKKVYVITEWTTPQTLKELRSFLGLANYFRRFVSNYSTVAHPLTALTGSGVPWLWTGEHEAAFLAIKTALASPPVLALPDFFFEDVTW